MEERPNWQFWSKLASAKLWQLVALSKGANPDWAAQYFNGQIFDADALDWEFPYRMTIAKNHLEEGTFEISESQVSNDEELSNKKVRIEEFYRFCIHMGWELPTEFPNPALQHELRELPAYLPPFLKFALTAIEKFGLSEESNLPIKTLQQLLKEKWPAELEDYYSDQRAYEIAKVLSPPKHDPKKRQTASKKPAGK
jgi:hypothetical protein